MSGFWWLNTDAVALGVALLVVFAMVAAIVYGLTRNSSDVDEHVDI